MNQVIFLIQRSIVLAMVILFLGASLLFSCKKHTYLSEEEVQAKIQKELSLGSSPEQVKGFVGAYQSKFEVAIDDYRPGIPKPPTSDAPEKELPKAQGYMGAWIQRTGTNPEIFAHYNIRLVFYFDQNKKMVGYKIYTMGTH